MTTREFIFYGGIAFCIVYLIYIIFMQITKSNARKDAINCAEMDYQNAKEEEAATKSQLIKVVTKVYGQEKAELVDKGTIWSGMPMHLLLIARGKANEIKKSVYKDTVTEKWYYGEYQTRQGTYKYKKELTLENDEVVGWKDLV
jgi:hypothetical protein